MNIRLAKRPIVFLACLLAAGTGTPAEAASPLTLRQVFSTPFVSDLTATRDGKLLVWVMNQEGRRNLWVAEPDGAPRRVTAYLDDDGQEISAPIFTPKGDAILYTRGGEPNGRGEVPNPLSRTEGTSQSVWIVPTRGGDPRKLGEGSTPAVSRAGDLVVWVKSGGIFAASVDRSKPAQQLFKSRGSCVGPVFSPDGSKLAFVSDRGDHSFVGVYDLKSETLTWADPAFDRDSEPVWSPDGARLAFIRQPGSAADETLYTLPSGAAWSIRVVDVATGTGTKIWEADAGRGADFWPTDSHAQLVWGAGDRIAFPWEKDGWLHVYSVAAAGGAATVLTPGAFDVETIVASPDGRSVVVASNQGDIERRHLWRVALSGGAAEPLTSGQGSEWAPVPLADGALAYVAATARQSGAVTVARAGAPARSLTASLVPKDFPADRLVEPQTVTFRAQDGLEVHGQLFLPPGVPPGADPTERRPAVIFTHGGSRRQMLPGFHYFYYYHNSYAFNQYLASRGYVVLSVNYRSGIMYGHDFREARNYGWRGGAEYQDLLAGAAFLRARPDVDAARVGLWGGSYGGYLTALGLARNSDLFRAGVDFHGVHDWSAIADDWQGRRGGTPDERRIAFESSPNAAIATWRSPVLLIHGDDDRNVPFSQTVDLALKLRQRGVPFEELAFPDEIHDFLTHEHWQRAYAVAAEFLDRRLASR